MRIDVDDHQIILLNKFTKLWGTIVGKDLPIKKFDIFQAGPVSVKQDYTFENGLVRNISSNPIILIILRNVRVISLETSF